MKKLMILGVSALVLAAPAAMAEHHDGHHKDKGELFAKQDINGDGIVTKDEFVQSYTARAEQKFSEIDANGDGQMTKEESEAAFAAMKEKWKEKREEKRKEHLEEKTDSAPAE